MRRRCPGEGDGRGPGLVPGPAVVVAVADTGAEVRVLRPGQDAAPVRVDPDRVHGAHVGLVRAVEPVGPFHLPSPPILAPGGEESLACADDQEIRHDLLQDEDENSTVTQATDVRWGVFLTPRVRAPRNANGKEGERFRGRRARDSGGKGSAVRGISAAVGEPFLHGCSSRNGRRLSDQDFSAIKFRANRCTRAGPDRYPPVAPPLRQYRRLPAHSVFTARFGTAVPKVPVPGRTGPQSIGFASCNTPRTRFTPANDARLGP